MIAKRKIILLVNLALISGCSWLALLDNPSPYADRYGCEGQSKKMIESARINIHDELVDATKEKVIARLGKPKSINYQSSYILRGCSKSKEGCINQIADEGWNYEFRVSVPKCGSYYYSLWIYFVDNRVVNSEP